MTKHQQVYSNMIYLRVKILIYFFQSNGRSLSCLLLSMPLAKFIPEVNYPSYIDEYYSLSEMDNLSFSGKTNYRAKFLCGWYICQHAFKMNNLSKMDNSSLNGKRFSKNEMKGVSINSKSFLELWFQQVLKSVLPPFLASDLISTYCFPILGKISYGKWQYEVF